MAGPILIDLRALQGAPEHPAHTILQQARPALPDRTLIGLIDPNRPALPPPALANLDSTCTTPHAARQTRPECFIRLAPCDDDAFTAPLLLDPSLPSVALADPPATTLARYWQSRADLLATAETLWETASALRRTESPKRLAIISPVPDLPLCRTLRPLGDVFGPSHVAALSPHYDQTLFLLTNTAEAAPLLTLLHRYGGSALLLDSCLLAAYDDDHATRLAERELRRPVPRAELLQWRAGIARPPALLLADIAAAADRLFVQSTWLADEIARRYGRTAILLPPPPDLPRIHADARGLHAESSVWALEMLHFWGRDARLDLTSPAAEQPALARLAAKLGLADRVGFTPGPAALEIRLAMRGQPSRAATVTPRIATSAVIEAVDLADAVILPDQPSPLLLAEAIAALLPPAAPDPTAQHIAEALGL